MVDGRKRVLFVDDEPQALAGLRVLLRRQRRQWDMVFVLGGQAGLEALESGDFDVVVTDMRMPGVSGDQVLRHALEHCPQAVRIILSGYAELEATMRAVPVAHQFLTKPCEPSVLREVVERACAVHELLDSEALRQTVGIVDELPALPTTFARAQNVMADPRSGCEDLAQVIQADPALHAKTLQLVNSGFFGLGRTLSSLRHAVSYLGFDLMRNLLLSGSLLEAFESESPVVTRTLFGLQRHGMLSGTLARSLLQGHPQAEDAFAAGVLQDIGRLLLLRYHESDYEPLLLAAEAEGRSLSELEREHFGCTHAEVGAYLLALWGLPIPIVEAIAHHHDPAVVETRELDALVAVHLAGHLASEQLRYTAADAERAPLDQDLLSSVGLSDLKPWRAEASRLAKAARAWR